MRITIDIDPSELQTSVKVEESKAGAIVDKATDAGGPPEFLVEALSETKEPQPDAAQGSGQDAGAGPAWPIEFPEAFSSFPDTSGNGS